MSLIDFFATIIATVLCFSIVLFIVLFELKSLVVKAVSLVVAQETAGSNPVSRPIFLN